MGASTPNGDADRTLTQSFATSSFPPAFNNWSFYSNPQVDKLIEEGRATGDQAQRDQITLRPRPSSGRMRRGSSCTARTTSPASPRSSAACTTCRGRPSTRGTRRSPTRRRPPGLNARLPTSTPSAGDPHADRRPARRLLLRAGAPRRSGPALRRAGSRRHRGRAGAARLRPDPSPADAVRVLPAQPRSWQPRGVVPQHRPAATVIAEHFLPTLWLSVAAIAAATLLGIGAGIGAAMNRDSPLDLTITVLSILGISTPSFFLGILFIYAFAVRLRVLPISGGPPRPASCCRR